MIIGTTATTLASRLASATSAVLLACVLAGVGGCATLLVTGAVDPNEAAEQAVEIAAAVTDALMRDDRVNAGDIRVAASGSVVTLNGSVPTGAERDRAVALTAATSGVSRVVDRLAVNGS